ncbi:hypothetical protein [Streptomyces sp. NPDC057494]
MQHHTVFEVMTHDVVTAAPGTPFKEVARPSTPGTAAPFDR